jgi:acetylornithine deacetylase/succinyl-diaminopimelate desuccinylase-like protein
MPASEIDVTALMREPGVANALGRVEAGTDRILEEAVRICQIPSPTFDEGERAAYVHARYEALGLKDVAIDAAGNVRGRRPGAGSGPSVAVVTHTDTVFPRGTDLTVKRQQGRLAAPGLGDNSLSIASALGIVEALDAAGVATDGDLYFAATTCEEGLGDLKGMRAYMEDVRDRVGAVVIVDGLTPGRIVHKAVGSRRYKVTYTARGGHSWNHFPAPSAVHILARAVADISRIEVPKEPKTTYNVGVIRGGTTVNTIASEAEMLVDMRSVDMRCLADLERSVLAIVERQAKDGEGQARLDLVGDRPAGVIPADHPLVQICTAIYRAFGIMTSSKAASTEANVPLSMGIPAVCLSVTSGENEHRPDEFIETAPLATGLKALLLILLALTGTR